MLKKFEINETKIKGGCQLGRKVVTIFKQPRRGKKLGKKVKKMEVKDNTISSPCGLNT